jgi:hypothetical protein
VNKEIHEKEEKKLWVKKGINRKRKIAKFLEGYMKKRKKILEQVKK